jgi:rRNA maturation RNase YbeY
MENNDIDIAYQIKNVRIRHKNKIFAWLLESAANEGFEAEFIYIIICDEKFLMKMNKQYLQHKTITDVITFHYDMPGKNRIAGEIYISYPQVKYNAATYKVTVSNELHRVMIHGLLHLCGYGDKTDKEKKIMTMKEDFYLRRIWF